MYLNGYSVSIVNGREKQDGYVEMEHGQTYELLLKNDNNLRCDAQVSIDGKEVGLFRVNPQSIFSLERPLNEAKKFTFYKKGTSEAKKAGEANISSDDSGLIQVVFKPEVKKYNLFYSWPQWDYYPYFDGPYFDGPYSRRIGWARPSEKWSTNTNSDESHTISVNTADVSELADDITSQYVRGEKSYYANCSSVCSNSTVERTCLRSAGITGLSESSNQRFCEVADLDYDYNEFVTISLRLISVASDIKEMTSVSKKNPILLYRGG